MHYKQTFNKGKNNKREKKHRPCPEIGLYYTMAAALRKAGY